MCSQGATLLHIIYNLQDAWEWLVPSLAQGAIPFPTTGICKNAGVSRGQASFFHRPLLVELRCSFSSVMSAINDVVIIANQDFI